MEMANAELTFALHPGHISFPVLYESHLKNSNDANAMIYHINAFSSLFPMKSCNKHNPVGQPRNLLRACGKSWSSV